MEDEEGILTPRTLLTSPSLAGGAAGAGGNWSWCHRWARDSCHRDMSRVTWVTGKCYCHESHVVTEQTQFDSDQAPDPICNCWCRIKGWKETGFKSENLK